MDITPNRLGATVDVTEDSYQLIDALADAFFVHDNHLTSLLLRLAETRQALADYVAQPEEHRSLDVIEAYHLTVDGIRDAIVATLDPAERVTVVVTEVGCRERAEEFAAAAAQSVSALARMKRLTVKPESGQVAGFPAQQDRRHAA